MGDHTEDEMKVIVKVVNDMLKQHISDLEKRIVRMELAFDALDRRLEGNARHPEDDGWFD